VYSPVVARERRSKAVADLLDTFSRVRRLRRGGAARSSRRKLSAEELDELDSLIAEARKKGR
jgi:hypothetical protein